MCRRTHGATGTDGAPSAGAAGSDDPSHPSEDAANTVSVGSAAFAHTSLGLCSLPCPISLLPSAPGGVGVRVNCALACAPP